MNIGLKINLLKERVRLIAIAVSVAIIAGVGLAPLLLGSASAAQMTDRKITLSTSKSGATSVTYNVSFEVTQTTVIKGIVVDLCMDSPLIGDTCSKTNGVANSPTNGTLNVTQNGNTVSFNVNAASNSNGKLVLTHATGLTPSGTLSTSPVTFSFTATNPTALDVNSGYNVSFYGRFLTYTDDSVAATYADNDPKTHLDDGGVALSTANQLTLTARVQEILEFCVGTNGTAISSPAQANDCGDVQGMTLNLGVVDFTTPNITPTDETNSRSGHAMVRTNAANGVAISYKAELESSSGRLKVVGASCGTNIDNTDQCFNSVGATNAEIDVAGSPGEYFGMTLSGVEEGNGSLTPGVLTRAANYDGNGAVGNAATCNANDPCWAWVDDGSVTEIASSTDPVDDAMIDIEFAALAAISTPAGYYQVVSTYIATATY